MRTRRHGYLVGGGALVRAAVLAALLLACCGAQAQQDAGAQLRAQKVPLLQAALKAAQDAGLDLLQRKITEQIAQASLEGGDLALAEKALIDIVNASEQSRDQLAFDPALRQRWFADNIGPYRKLLRIAALRNEPYLALSVGERMRSRVLGDQLSWQKVDMGLRLPKGVGKRLEALRGNRKQVYALLQKVMGGGELTADDTRGKYMPIRGFYMPIRGPLDTGKPATSEDAAKLKDLLKSLAAEETALESAVREAVPAYSLGAQNKIPKGEDLAAAITRDPTVAVLEYTLTDQGLAVVALRGGRTPKTAIIPVTGDDLWGKIGKFRELIWERKPEADTQATDLYRLLVTPVEDMLAGAKRVRIVADGALQLVPFAALRDAEGKYLAERCAVAFSPSLNLVFADRPAPRQKATLPALVVAAPDTGAESEPVAQALSPASDEAQPATTDDPRGKYMPIRGDDGKYMPIRGMYMPIRGYYMPIRGEGGVSDALIMMASVALPGARAEGEAIAKQLAGATLLTGKAATKASLLAKGGSCDVLHIATHGYADPDAPEFSALLLAGAGEKPFETLTAQEVYLWPLNAKLVTLSACQTGLGRDVEGEGLMGLTRAFICAGARDVLCSLWPVSDDSTAKLMTRFYVSRGRSPAVEQALQEAQQALIADPATRHPFFWAGFIAVRGPQ